MLDITPLKTDHGLHPELTTILAVTFILGVLALLVLYFLSKKPFAKSLFKPVFYLWILILLLSAYDVLQHHYGFLQDFAVWVSPAKKAITFIFIWWFVIGWLGSYVNNLISAKKEANLSRETYEPLIVLKKLLSAGISIMFVLLILSNLGVQISALLAVGGISGIALSYAAKDILNNILSGFILNITHPFQEGDVISVPSKSLAGQVADMGFYYTTIIDQEDRKAVYAPNAIFANAAIKNDSK